MLFSVIIPTYNGASVLRKSLATWVRQTFRREDFEVLVVDNNSTEDIAGVVESVKMESGVFNVRYLKETTPGATAARHCGAREAKGEYLVFADNDGLYNPECLEEIKKVYDGNPQCEAVACKIEIQWDGDEPDWIGPYKYLLGQLDYGDKISYSTDYYLNGGIMSVRKSVFERLGGFNPDLVEPYLIGDGDLGFVRKLHAEKALIGWTPFAHMWHMQQVAKHGSKAGVALHCYNNGIADSYARFRANNFRMTVSMWKYLLTKTVVWMKWCVRYVFHHNQDTYFKLRQHTGELRFFVLLLKPELRKLIKEN